MLDFPNAPAVNDTWTATNGVTYVWTGTMWAISGSTGSSAYVPLSGNVTMTGPLGLSGDPTTSPQAANKHYVDQSINLAGNYLGTWSVAANSPNISAGGSISNANYVATTVNPSTPETVPVGVPGIAGMSVANGDRIIWAAGLGVWQILRNAGVTLAAADARYYAITNPSGYQTAANVTTALVPYAPLAAPVFTGDARAVTPSPGDNDTSIATTAFVLGNGAGTAPTMNSAAAAGTATTFSRGDHVHPSDTSRLPIAGGTVTGALTVNGNLTASNNLISQNCQVGPLTVLNPASASLTVQNNAAGNFAAQVQNAGPGGGSSLCVRVDRTDINMATFLWGASTAVGFITTNGTGVTYGTASDARLKSGVVSLPPEDSGAIVDAVSAVWFNWISTGEREPGFIAQDVQPVYPWAVWEGKGEPGQDDFQPWVMDAGKLMPIVMAELKALRARTADLEARVESLGA